MIDVFLTSYFLLLTSCIHYINDRIGYQVILSYYFTIILSYDITTLSLLSGKKIHAPVIACRAFQISGIGNVPD